MLFLGALAFFLVLFVFFLCVFFGPSSHHTDQKTWKKNLRGLACCYGEKPHQQAPPCSLHPVPPLPPTTNFTTITTTTTTILQRQTSLLYVHCYQTPPPRLFSQAIWTVCCCQAQNGEERGRWTRDITKFCTGGEVTLAAETAAP